MVAKSYQSLEVISDVFTINGRSYVKVRDKYGNPKQVRWYTDQEYQNMYKEKAPISNSSWMDNVQPETLGFKEGFVTVFRGNTYSVKDWLKEHGARFSALINWYIPSDIPLPESFPEGIEPVKLEWAAMIDPATGKFGSPDYIKAMIPAYIYSESKSDYVGTIGERSEFTVKLCSVRTIPTQFGYSNLYTFCDKDANIIIYFGTSTLSMEVGNKYRISAIVRDHSVYRNEKQTRVAYIKVKELIND